MIGQVRDAVGKDDWDRAGYLIDGLEVAFPEVATAPAGTPLARRRDDLGTLRELISLQQRLAAGPPVAAAPPASGALPPTPFSPETPFSPPAPLDPAMAGRPAAFPTIPPVPTLPTSPSRQRSADPGVDPVASTSSPRPGGRPQDWVDDWRRPSASGPAGGPAGDPANAAAADPTGATSPSEMNWQAVATPLPSVWDGVIEPWLLADAESADAATTDEAFTRIDAPTSLFDSVLEAAAVEASARQAQRRLTAFTAVFDGSGTDRRRIRSALDDLKRPAADDLFRIASNAGDWGSEADHKAMRADIARRLLVAAGKTHDDKLSDAVADFDAIALIDPTDPRPVLLASMLRMSPGAISGGGTPQGELNRAARGFRRLLRQHDGYLPAQHNLGLVVLKQGDRSAAVNILNTAAMANRSSSRLDANLERMLRLQSQRQITLSDEEKLAVSRLRSELQPWNLSTELASRVFDVQKAEEMFLMPEVMTRRTDWRSSESTTLRGRGWLLAAVPVTRRVRSAMPIAGETTIWTVPNRQSSGVLVTPRVVAVPRSVVTDPAGGTCALVTVRAADGAIWFGQPLVVSSTYDVALVGLNRRTDAYLPPAAPPLQLAQTSDPAVSAQVVGQQPFDRSVGQSGPPVSLETQARPIGTGLLQLTKSGPAGSAMLVDGQLAALTIDSPPRSSLLETLVDGLLTSDAKNDKKNAKNSQKDAGDRTGQPLAVSASVIAGMLDAAAAAGLIDEAGDSAGPGVAASNAAAAVVEVRSIRILTAMGMELPHSIADPLEECSCPGCGGTGRMMCENQCNRGRLTESRRVRTGYNPLTESPVYQDKFFKVDCPSCQGGTVKCRQCYGLLYQRQ